MPGMGSNLRVQGSLGAVQYETAEDRTGPSIGIRAAGEGNGKIIWNFSDESRGVGNECLIIEHMFFFGTDSGPIRMHVADP